LDWAITGPTHVLCSCNGQKGKEEKEEEEEEEEGYLTRWWSGLGVGSANGSRGIG
jgi:hypothetical protein